MNLTISLNATGYAVENCLARSLSDSNFLRQAATSYAETCAAEESYEDAWNCFIDNPHGAGHSSVGGSVSSPYLHRESCTCMLTESQQMFDVTMSPSDPLFFLHHSYLDKLWWEWESVNTSTRLTDISGRNYPENAYLLVDSDYIFPLAQLLENSGDPGNVTTLAVYKNNPQGKGKGNNNGNGSK